MEKKLTEAKRSSASKKKSKKELKLSKSTKSSNRFTLALESAARP